MERLTVKLENCYGIQKLEHTFDFSKCDFSKCRTYAIYAPNGSMKTSFAKTFKDLSENKISKDLMFINRVSSRELKKDNNDLEGKDVFVVESYNPQMEFKSASTLLVDSKLRGEYEKIHIDIDSKKEMFLEEVSKLSNVKAEVIENEIAKCYSGDFFEIIESFEAELDEKKNFDISKMEYNVIFNERVLGFLNTAEFKDSINEYMRKYNDLLEKSKYLKFGFDHYNVSSISKNLNEHGFFKAKHSLNLNDGETKKEVFSNQELEEIIQNEKKQILQDSELRKKWESIDNKFRKNVDVKKLFKYLFDNPEIIKELYNIDIFRKKIWSLYFAQQKNLFDDLLQGYRDGKEQISIIIEKAKTQKNDWHKVINIFNNRFYVPFIVKIENQDDVILKGKVPNIKFYFIDLSNGNEIRTGKEDLLQVLSSGERRALYILDIIFEIEARKKANQETLLIIDDLADSFDYKNKYAIVQYLKDIDEENIFSQIILSHNFDFFRTVQGRILDKNRREFSLIAQRDKNGNIELLEAGSRDVVSPFDELKKRINMDYKALIAGIPFVRNLIEYREGTKSDGYSLLTSLLHIKEDTEGITIADIYETFKNTLINIDFKQFDKQKKVLDLIFEKADEILENEDSQNCINLENKILLSLAIRLQAEKFMWSKVSNRDEINNSQTGKLFGRYKKKFENDTSEAPNIEVLENVVLMTPENIHLNSFMYEPIIDMSDWHLKELYDKVKKLSSHPST